MLRRTIGSLLCPPIYLSLEASPVKSGSSDLLKFPVSAELSDAERFLFAGAIDALDTFCSW
jgi:hypothetical protein